MTMKSKSTIFACLICLMAILGTNKASAQLAKGYYYVHVALDTHYCLDLHALVFPAKQRRHIFHSLGNEYRLCA